jgi:hypothetical protein
MALSAMSDSTMNGTRSDNTVNPARSDGQGITDRAR